jgi:hypothetical protein
MMNVIFGRVIRAMMGLQCTFCFEMQEVRDVSRRQSHRQIQHRTRHDRNCAIQRWAERERQGVYVPKKGVLPF